MPLSVFALLDLEIWPFLFAKLVRHAGCFLEDLGHKADPQGWRLIDVASWILLQLCFFKTSFLTSVTEMYCISMFREILVPDLH